MKQLWNLKNYIVVLHDSTQLRSELISSRRDLCLCRAVFLINMQKIVIIFTVAVFVLLMPADVSVRADEDDVDDEETGLFTTFCSGNRGPPARGRGMLYL